MKRMLALLLTLTLALGLLAGCGTTVVVAVPAPTPEAETPTPSPETPPAAVPGGIPVKTGLALLTSVSSSKDATADAAPFTTQSQPLPKTSQRQQKWGENANGGIAWQQADDHR